MNATMVITADMSELAEVMLGTVLTLAPTTPYPEWLATGHNLAAMKRGLDWQVGDWIAFGRQHFPEQVELALADMSNDPRAIRRIEKTTTAFPPHLRSSALTFDHHAHVADMPVQEALPLLREAESQNLTARQLRNRAVIRKVETGQILPREDDHDDDALLACVRAWNRAPMAVREDFAEMVSDSALQDIEP